MAKPRNSSQTVAARPVSEVALKPAVPEPTSVFLDFLREFDQAYSREVDQAGWLAEGKRYPQIALLAFRRWLRRDGFDVEVTRCRSLTSKRRFKDAVAFQVTFDKELGSAYEHELQQGFGGIQFEVICRTFGNVLARYGWNLSAAKQLPNRELKLVRVIDSQLPEATCQRYRELSQRCSDETLKPVEHKELLKLVNVVEGHHVQRLQAVQKLARLRGHDFFDLLVDVGLGKPSDA